MLKTCQNIEQDEVDAPAVVAEDREVVALLAFAPLVRMVRDGSRLLLFIGRAFVV